MTSFKELVETVRTRMGGATKDEAVAAIHATLAALGEHMGSIDALAVAAALPPPFDATLRNHIVDMKHDLRSFYARVAAREGVELGFAMEHAQAVCRALMLVGDDVDEHLSVDVWPELLRPGLADARASAPPSSGRGRTLADGRPGSAHPLSEAPPPDRAQSESVVRSPNPHGDRKISSGL